MIDYIHPIQRGKSLIRQSGRQFRSRKRDCKPSQTVAKAGQTWFWRLSAGIKDEESRR